MAQKYIRNRITGVIFKHDDYQASLPDMEPCEAPAEKKPRTRRTKPVTKSAE